MNLFPTKLFLANPDLPSSVAEVFHLNDQEVEAIRGLLPKREMYLRRSDEFAILRLEVDKAKLLALHILSRGR